MQQLSEREIELQKAGLPNYQTKKFKCTKKCRFSFSRSWVLIELLALQSVKTEELKVLLTEIVNAQQEQLVAETTCDKLEMMSTADLNKQNKETNRNNKEIEKVPGGVTDAVVTSHFHYQIKMILPNDGL